jgi:branched-chain amino acid transport system ATP-binding protein
MATLTINNAEVIYSDVILVLRSISLKVEPGKIVTLLGANGAGKSTTLKAISGLLVRDNGAVTRGSIEYDGQRLDKLAPEEITRLGIVQVLEGRRLFPHLTTEENLKTGALIRPRQRNGRAAGGGLPLLPAAGAACATARPAISLAASSRWWPLAGR